MVINYAHRGSSGYYPENTMLSFEKAVEDGCDGIETDVQMTRDGVLVLIHDEKVDRTTNGTGHVGDYTYDELLKLDAGSWKSEKFSGCRIPAFEDLLEFAKEKNIKINYEIKTGIVMYEGIEEKIINTIYKYGMENNVILSSFNHYSMVECKKISREIKTGLLYADGLYKPEIYCRYVGADAIHPVLYAMREEVIGGVKAAGILINVYTVNDEKYMKYFIKLGVDGIITNYPDRLRKILVNKNA
ncbi:MAG TPA: hypothetical protein DD426_05390 [Clostridiaceae bacterium]|nr:hypothetical protein [Clostridiaceae bacterium]